MTFTIKINGLELEVYDGDQPVFRSVSRAKVYRFVFESGIRDSAPKDIMQLDRQGELIFGYDMAHDIYVILETRRWNTVFYNKHRIIVENEWLQRTGGPK